MIDTEDLSSYIPGYEDYILSHENEYEYEKEYDNSDELHDEYMLRKGQEQMENREIIDLNYTNLTVNDINNLHDYIWEKDKLIPAEMIEGE
jgi:hypothetical protein